MTGEMGHIGQDGIDSNGEHWPIHAKIAKAVGGRLEPFDKYRGPYIVVGKDVRRGSPPYAVAVQGVGVVRLWIVSDGEEGMARIYREDTDEASETFFWDEYEIAVELAKKLLA